VEVDRPAPHLVGELLVDLAVREDLPAAVALEMKAAVAVVIDFVGAVLVPAEARPKAAAYRGGVPIRHRAHSSKTEPRAGARDGAPARPEAGGRASGFRPLVDGRGVPEGMPSRDWSRLKVLGSWPAAAGHPLRGLTRAHSFDAAGVLTVGVASARWALELAPHLETLRTRVGALSGVTVASIVLRVETESGPRS